MAGTDYRRPTATGGPAIVLVAPQLGENIGTATRAMFNCGLSDLRLVAPRDGWPSEKARSAASGAGMTCAGRSGARGASASPSHPAARKRSRHL